MNPRTFLTLLILLATAFFCSGAFAQDDVFLNNFQDAQNAPETPVNDHGGFFDNLGGTVSKLRQKANPQQISKTMNDQAFKTAANLTPAALKIGGALMSMYLIFEMVQFMAGRSPSIVQVMFDVAIPAMIAGVLINTYADKIGMLEQLLDTFRNVGGAQNPIDSVFNMYSSIMGSVGESFAGILSNHGGLIDLMLKPGQVMAAAIDSIACLLFLLLILYLIAMGAADVFGLILLGPFLHAVGIAFGPLLIIGLITPWTMNYFKTWLGFLVISAALTGVLNVILVIASSVITAVGLDVTASGGEYGSAVSLMVTTLLLMTVNSMIGQAPGITSALLPGTLGARATGGAQQAALSKSMRQHGKEAKGVAKTSSNIIKAVKERSAAGRAAKAAKAAGGTP